jgi:hypothetical protein
VIFQVSIDDPSDLSIVKMVAPDVPDEALRQLTTVIDVPLEVAAERIRRLYENLGISYFSLNKTAGTSWNTPTELVGALR